MLMFFASQNGVVVILETKPIIHSFKSEMKTNPELEELQKMYDEKDGSFGTIGIGD